MSASADHKDAVMAAAVEAEGYQYVGHERVKSFGRDALAVYIDTPSGVTMDDCAKVSRVLSVVLAAEELLGKQESLEVSSPGIDRPLFTRDHYLAYVGKTIKVKTMVPLDGRRRFKGVLQAVLDDHIEVIIDGQVVAVTLRDVEKANACISEQL
jgi:ribosome maturation factor RimP